MTHKLELYYVVKVTDGCTSSKAVVYLSGPFGDIRDAINSKREQEYKILADAWVEIATQYIEVEI